MTFVLAALFGFALGAVPFGLLLTRLAGLGDIRKIGSGNIGTTNVLRTGRKDLAAATLILDGGKGAVAALLAGAFAGPLAGLVAGTAACFGHCFSPFVNFRGGKGVATGLGTFLAWSWQAGLLCLVAWLAGALLSRRSSVGALAAMAAAPPLLWWRAGPDAALAGLIVALLSYARHHQNISRLLAGTEPRIGQRS